MSPLQMLHVLHARRRLVIAVFGGIVLLTIVVTLLLPKIYVAETSLIVDPRRTELLTGTAVQEQAMTNYLATTVDVITSRNVALKVVDKLRLAEEPSVAKQFERATGGEGSIRDWLADKLRNNLDVKPARESSVVNIAFLGRDPQFAAVLANAFAEAYIQTTLDLKIVPARRQADWFQAQVQGLRKNLESAQKRLSDYQREHGIAGADERLDVENTKLAEISNELVGAQAALVDVQTRQRQLTQALEKGQVDQLPDVLGNSLLQSMKADLARAEGRLADVAQRYDRNHPQYKSAVAEAAALKSKLAAELTTATGSIKQSEQIAQRRVAELQRTLDQQKARILQLKQQRDSTDVLTREVENSQHIYDAAIQRGTALRLEGEIDQSTVAVLNPAVAPLMPARPRVMLNLLLACVIGGLVSVGAAIAAERLDRRVRSGIDLVETTGLPVLGEISHLLIMAPQRT